MPRNTPPTKSPRNGAQEQFGHIQERIEKMAVMHEPPKKRKPRDVMKRKFGVISSPPRKRRP